jgi:chromosome segregation ATPase
VPKITAENERLQKTVANLTTQVDNSEKKLEEERIARKALEDSRDSKIKEVEQSWSAVLSEKQDNWEAKEKSLEEKVESQDRLLKEVKASYEVSQRLGKGEDAEGESRSGATAAELEIVSSELERTSHRLAEVESRNEQLRLELAQSASSHAQHVAVEDDPSFLRLRSENSSLLRKLEHARFEKDSDRTRLETETRSLEREIKSLKSEKEALREKVQKWGDYDNVKQELEVLKVGYNNSKRGAELMHCSRSSLQPETTTMKPPSLPSHKMAQPAKERARRSNNCCLRETRSSATSSQCFASRTRTYKAGWRLCKRSYQPRTWNLRSRGLSTRLLKPTSRRSSKKHLMPLTLQVCPWQELMCPDSRNHLRAEAAHHQPLRLYPASTIARKARLRRSELEKLWVVGLVSCLW